MELLERFAAGDVDAFEALFRQYQGEVYRWIMRIVRNTAVAEDLTLETFWRMHRAHARFDPASGNCGAWLRRIATNAAIDHLRQARREVPLPDDLPATVQQPPGEQVELRRQILRAVDKLSPRLRAVVLLALVEEEPYARIAEALGISENAVKVRVFRGVRILRKKLSEAGVHQ
ncbi:MAG TPA: RNA polymerase sigma factor [Verrucomicrobiae bacterium]|nr:RNA polymerase sigma factor [Verrucomicrobiae bacterium]